MCTSVRRDEQIAEALHKDTDADNIRQQVLGHELWHDGDALRVKATSKDAEHPCSGEETLVGL